MASLRESRDRDAPDAPATDASAEPSLFNRLAPWLPALLALTGWWKLRELLYRTHWDRGPTIFLLLLLSIALVLVVPYLARVVARNAAVGGGELAGLRPRRGWRLAIVLFGVALWALADDVRVLSAHLTKTEVPLIDIGGNTWAAAVRFTDFGQNPYTHRTQLVPVTGAPGVEEEGGRVTMFGVPYYYGFPYFPAMFLSYAPFRAFERGQHSIRIANAFWLAVTLAGAGWLAYRLAPERRRPPAAG